MEMICQIRDHVTQFEHDSRSGICDPIEREATGAAEAGHAVTGYKRDAEAAPYSGAESKADSGYGDGFERQEATGKDTSGAGEIGLRAPQDTGQAPELTRSHGSEGYLRAHRVAQTLSIGRAKATVGG